MAEPTFRGDSLIMPKLLKLHDCLCSELAASGLNLLCDCLLLHGSGGQLGQPTVGKGIAWVGLTNIFPYKNFPSPDIGDGRCDGFIAAAVTVGLMRCYAVKTNGESEADMIAYMDKQMADMAAMRRAIVCCAKEDFDVSLGQYTPIGPEGGIYGGSWAVTLG